MDQAKLARMQAQVRIGMFAVEVTTHCVRKYSANYLS